MSNNTVKILGIDPGIAITGWGMVNFDGNKCLVDSYGAIITKADQLIEDRLGILFNDLNEVIEEFNPTIIAIEKIFYFKNAKTIINVGQARGVTLLSAKKNDLVVFEYTPLQVKQSVTGYGRAGKGQIQQMIKNLLNLDEVPTPDDVADALAVAYTHSVINNCMKIKQ